jgi:nickel/cobalt transporter (NicO) family protein
MTTFARRAVPAALVLIVLLLLCGAFDAALAQAFGVGPRPAAAPAPGGFSGWIIAKQAEFYREIATALRAAKADGSAAVTLLGISFAYGVFHAAGPGHGKAVISSYLVANNETWRRGVVLSFASAMLQAMTAILIVGIAAALLGATAKMMGDTVRVIEIVSYALIALVGARLTYVKGRGFIRALRGEAIAHDHGHGHPHTHGSHQHDHGHDHHRHHHGADAGRAGHAEGSVHAHAHGHDDHAGHSHGPVPEELAGPGGWKRGLAAIVAVGLRPCSGAIIVLVFALAQGLFLIGVASTFVMGLGTAITVAAIATLAVAARGLAGKLASGRPGAGMIALRGLEAGAAVVVLLFGMLLLTGYLASERLMGI